MSVHLGVSFQVCHYCRQRVPVLPALVPVSANPAQTLLDLVRRRFVEHDDGADSRCAGSGRMLAEARGRDGPSA